MLTEIEQAILTKLSDNGLSSKIFDARADRQNLSPPVVFCAIEEASFSRVTMNKVFKQEVSIFLTIVFETLENEAARRSGIYPILEGVIGLLMLQKLGLAITPIVPVGYKNVTDKEDAQNGQLWFQIEFKTSFNIEKTDDEADAVELLKIGLEYYLQDPEDDGVKDAEDEITLK